MRQAAAHACIVADDQQSYGESVVELSTFLYGGAKNSANGYYKADQERRAQEAGVDIEEVGRRGPRQLGRDDTVQRDKEPTTDYLFD